MFVAVVVAGPYSGDAHLNPAVTIALAGEKFSWSSAIFIGAQFLGSQEGFIGVAAIQGSF